MFGLLVRLKLYKLSREGDNHLELKLVVDLGGFYEA